MAEGLASAVMGEIRIRPHRGRVRDGLSETDGLLGRGSSGDRGLRSRLWQAGQGGHAAVLKTIHRGGTHTPKQLGTQLDYLFSKAAWCGGNIVDYDPRRQSISPEERKAIVTAWSDDWARDPKNGHTTHLLMSFPQHVRPEKARAIAEDWAASMFEDEGCHGDQWSYVAALHTDRAHPHVHIVVQNRGVIDGRWFYMAKGHDFDLQAMKEKMAGIAAEHGVALETTSRVERGILTYGPSRGEIETARREGRPVREEPRMGAALETALADIRTVSAAYQELAFLARATEARDVASRMAAGAEALKTGRIFIPHQTESVMSEPETFVKRRDFELHVESWRVEMSAKLATLPLADRAELKPGFSEVSAKAMEALGDRRGADLARAEARSDLYRVSVEDGRVRLGGSEIPGTPERAREFGATLVRAAAEAGLDGEAVAGRIRRGALNALEERDWIKADVAAVAGQKGLDLGRADQRAEAAGIVDRFYEKAAGLIADARGVKHESAADQLRRTLTAMTEVETKHGPVRFDNDEVAKTLSEDLKRRYGETVVNDLANGRTDALATDFADPGLRQKIARAVVAAAVEHETIGLSLKDARAAQERMRAEAERERPRDRSRDSDREL